MRVKFCFTDSGTGENDQVTLTVQNMSHNEFERVFNQYVNVDHDLDQVWELKSLINNGKNFAATFTHTCSYFGPMIITGIAYPL